MHRNAGLSIQRGDGLLSWAFKERRFHSEQRKKLAVDPRRGANPQELGSWVYMPTISEFFSQVTVDPTVGTIVWPNDADYAPDTLHRWVREGRTVVPV